MNGLNINPNHMSQYNKWGYGDFEGLSHAPLFDSIIYDLYKSQYFLGDLFSGLNTKFQVTRSFRSDKFRKFLGHIVFNESLNGPRIALNIMNEAKKF